MMKHYKIVATIEFPDGHEEYVIWEPEFYGQMVYNNVSVDELFYNTSQNGFSDAPVSVLLELWENPLIQKIVSKLGDKEVLQELLIGNKVFPIRRF